VTKARPRRRRLRLTLTVIAVVLVLIIVGTGGAAWYFSDQLLAVSHGPSADNVKVLHVTSRTLSLTSDSGISNQGRFAVLWPHGRAVVGPAFGPQGQSVTRPIVSESGGLHRGEKVRYDVFVYRSPADLGLAYRSIRYSDPLGPMPAWLIPAAGSTWVISVHGLDSSRAEALRALPVLHNLGLPDMDIGYRNDAGAPSSPDHLYHLGASEWLDLQAAARYALSHGAHSLVLYGYSMGGNIVESFMAHSALATKVRAIVLDAPALDWYQILELAAEQRDLPGVFSAVVERVVACRIGLSSLDPIDHLVTQLRSVPPTLLFQGTADSLVPPRSNLEFARKYPRSVTIELFSGANHVQSWNVNPGRYDRVLSRFLRTHLGCSTAGCG